MTSFFLFGFYAANSNIKMTLYCSYCQDPLFETKKDEDGGSLGDLDYVLCAPCGHLYHQNCLAKFISGWDDSEDEEEEEEGEIIEPVKEKQCYIPTCGKQISEEKSILVLPDLKRDPDSPPLSPNAKEEKARETEMQYMMDKDD